MPIGILGRNIENDFRDKSYHKIVAPSYKIDRLLSDVSHAITESDGYSSLAELSEAVGNLNEYIEVQGVIIEKQSDLIAYMADAADEFLQYVPYRLIVKNDDLKTLLAWATSNGIWKKVVPATNTLVVVIFDNAEDLTMAKMLGLPQVV